MKQIIGFLRYDTTTATQIATNSNNKDVADFYYEKETLYKTISGEFFLKIESYHDSFLLSISRNTAFLWLEKNRKTEALETYFSQSIKDA